MSLSLLRCRRSIPRVVTFLAGLTIAVGAVAPRAASAQVKFFRMQSRAAFAEGTLDGIALDPLGTLALADRARRLGGLDEPFLFSAAPHPGGWVVGTGNAGRVQLIARDGTVTTLFESPESEIFAVWADDDGTVFAGSSPDGKVYRIADGVGEEFFDPGETYIWSLARATDGSLLVGTGTEGRLYQVDGSGDGRVVFDSEDTHIRALEPLPSGAVLIGTAGRGLILKMDPDGRTRTLYDAVQPETVAFAVGPDGDSFAAVLASEASVVDLNGGRVEAANGQGENGEAEEDEAVAVTVSSEGSGEAFAGSRPQSYRGARSQILRIRPQGTVESVWTFEDETVYSLLWHRDRLWVGTGLEGRLYSYRDEKMLLEKDVDERQIVALVEDRPGPAFATANASAFYRISVESERSGVYFGPTLDAGQTSRFGTLSWRGEVPKKTGLAFALRSGMSSEPDSTWSPWSPSAAGGQISLADVPEGRYLQWRAELEGAASHSPLLSEVVVSYRQLNLPPRIASLEVMDPGEILVPANFNPTNQVFEPAHPNRDGIFTTLGAAGQRDERRQKTLWKQGYRTLRWEAEDANEDQLTYALSFRPESADEVAWLPIAERLDATHHSFDASALPDGRYRFRLLASDRGEQDLEEALEAQRLTEPVVIDNSPPVLIDVRRRSGRVTAVVEDALNPLRDAVFSADAEEWLPARPSDGLLDDRRETLEFEPPADAGFVLLRVTDAAFNVRTIDLSGGSR